MNNEKIISKVQTSMYQQCQKRGYATVVDVLMDLGVLTKQAYENWRFGRVDYLEKVCTTNLHKLSFIVSNVYEFAKTNSLKPSFCYYKRYGMKKAKGNKVVQLRFSKSGAPSIEKRYATHFIDYKQMAQLKEEKKAKTT